jgi:outer membrane receptor protein involved in Fe transport
MGISRGLSQAPEPGVLQSPEVVVTTPVLASDAAGTTRILVDPGAPPSAGSWDALGASAANVHAAESGAGGYGSLFSIRGLSNTPYFSEPAVTAYFGDIPLASSFAYPTGLFGFGSVEVHRGPGGAEFGRATDGGVVVFQPSGVPAGGSELLAGAGSYDARMVAATASAGSQPGAAVLVAASYDARDGYIENDRLGIRVGDEEDENLFASLSARLSPSGLLTLELLRTRSRDGAQPLVPLGGPLFEVSRAEEGATDLDSWGAALKGEFQLPGGASLTTVTSATDWRMNPYRSFLVIPPPLTNLVLQDQKSWNEELHLRSDPASPLRGSLGAWFSKGTTDNFVARALPGLYPVEVSGSEQDERSGAVFGEVAFDPLPALELKAGLRAEADAKDFERREQVPTPGLDYSGDGRYGALLPSVSATWTLPGAGRVQAAVAAGLRPGGFASFTDSPAFIPFASERTTACSLGWDTTFADKSADAAVRVFYDCITNLQIERSFTATDYFVATAPRAHAVGAEVEARWRPSRDWTLSLDAGTSTVVLDTFYAPLTGQNESGGEAPDAPRFNAGLEVAYRAASGWFAAGQVTLTGTTDYDEVGTSRFSQGAYALAGLRAGFEARRWTLTLYGENLGDTRYYALIVPGVNSGEPGAPRTVGARLALRY